MTHTQAPAVGTFVSVAARTRLEVGQVVPTPATWLRRGMVNVQFPADAGPVLCRIAGLRNHDDEARDALAHLPKFN